MTAHDEHGPNGKYETRDAHLPSVMGTAFAFVGLMVVGMAFAWGVYEIFITETSDPGVHAPTFVVPDSAALPPGPNLEPDPSANLAALRSHEDQILNNYAWTDSARGIARVPVARAMELYLERNRK